MSKDKKPAKASDKKVKPDVARPGRSAPSSTSRPVIVTNRPILKDPMVVDVKFEDEDFGEDNLTHAGAPKLQPLDTEQGEGPEDRQTEQPAKKEEPAKEEEKVPSTSSESETKLDAEPPNDQAQASKTGSEPEFDEKDKIEAAEHAKQQAAVQELIDSRKYELPINSVEKRKARHFVVLGILLAAFLALAWADIALDAGLIHVEGVKPVTHLFSN